MFEEELLEQGRQHSDASERVFAFISSTMSSPPQPRIRTDLSVWFLFFKYKRSSVIELNVRRLPLVDYRTKAEIIGQDVICLSQSWWVVTTAVAKMVERSPSDWKVEVFPSKTLNSKLLLMPMCMSVWIVDAPVWAGGSLRGSHCHQCMNVSVNLWMQCLYCKGALNGQ